VDRCLAKGAEDRYVSTTDLARELATLRDRVSDASISDAVPARGSRLPASLAVLALLAAAALGFFGGRPLWKAAFSSRLTLRQITFRRAGIGDARFAPDGQVIYGAAGAGVKGSPGELFSVRPGTPEPRSLGLPPANIVAVSRSGELAILVGGFSRLGTLATVPLAGGSPREVLENVRKADWGPDGKSLAVVHLVGRPRLEYPIGKVLYTPRGWIGGVRFSPKGNLIAFDDNDAWVPAARQGHVLTVIGPAGGAPRKIAPVPYEFKWSPLGNEFWINDFVDGTTSIYSLSMSGRRRLLASFPGDFALHDVASDGRVLLERVTEEHEIIGHLSGEPIERNLSWLDGSLPADLSSDGRVLLFNEMGQGGGSNHAVYLRRTDGSPAVRLGEGIAHSLSPDGSWALITENGDASELVLLPTGPGQPRKVGLAGIKISGRGASFFPDGKRILLRGSESGRLPRLYALDIPSGAARALTPEGLSVNAEIRISPDGRTVFSSSDDGESVLYDVEGGPSQPIRGIPPNHRAIGWSADGKSLFVRSAEIRPLKVYRLDLAAGRLDLWKEFSVPDLGTGEISVIPTADGRSYVYGYTRYFSDLFIAEGLK